MASTRRPTYLRIDNAAEDVPRRIQGHGRTPDGGTWGLVILPHEHRSMLLVADKTARGQAPTFRCWTSDGKDHPDGKVDVIGPLSPEHDPDGAVQALRQRGHMALGKRTPITLRGKWKGSVRWDGERPVVELTREVSTYVALTVVSFETNAGPAWRWILKRDARWFTDTSADFGEALTFKGAVAVALRQLEGIVGEACTVRDTRRRGAMETGYTGRAGRVREAPVTGRGVDRFKVPKKRTAPKSAANPKTGKSGNSSPPPDLGPLPPTVERVFRGSNHVAWSNGPNEFISVGPSRGNPPKGTPPTLAVVRERYGNDFHDDDTAEKRERLRKYIRDGFNVIGKLAPPPAKSTTHARGLVEGFLLQNQWPGKVTGARKVRGQDLFIVDIDAQGTTTDPRWAYLANVLSPLGFLVRVDGGVPAMPTRAATSPAALPTAQGILTAAQLLKATAKHVDKWNAKRDERSAKGWVRSAFHHMGLGAVELSAQPTAHKQVVVKLESVEFDARDGDTQERLVVVQRARPAGLLISNINEGTPAPTVAQSSPKVASKAERAQTVDELIARTAAERDAFENEPTRRNATGWTRAAMKALGMPKTAVDTAQNQPETVKVIVWIPEFYTDRQPAGVYEMMDHAAPTGLRLCWDRSAAKVSTWREVWRFLDEVMRAWGLPDEPHGLATIYALSRRDLAAYLTDLLYRADVSELRWTSGNEPWAWAIWRLARRLDLPLPLLSPSRESLQALLTQHGGLPGITGGRPVEATAARHKVAAFRKKHGPSASAAQSTPVGVTTWSDVVDDLDAAYAAAGIPEQPAPIGLSRRGMAVKVAEALRTGVYEESIRTSNKATVKALSALLGLKGSARPKTNAAWEALFQGRNLLPGVTGEMPTVAPTVISRPKATPTPKRPKPSASRRPSPKPSKPTDKADKNAIIAAAAKAEVANQMSMFFGGGQ